MSRVLVSGIMGRGAGEEDYGEEGYEGGCWLTMLLGRVVVRDLLQQDSRGKCFLGRVMMGDIIG